MSIPPPGAFTAPADDWTDDPSFDLSTDKSFPGSSSSSSSRSSRGSLGLSTRLSGSPLRQVHSLQLKTAKQPDLDEDDFDDFGDFDLPDASDSGASTIKAPQQLLLANMVATPKAPRTISATSSTVTTRPSSMRTIAATIVGQGPTGVGTITRLGSKPSANANLPIGSVRARAKAMEKAWEADVDFGSVNEAKLRKSLSPAKAKFVMPDADALDDLGFDLEDEDQATLKAGATIKAMLPPPRSRNGSGGDTVKGPPSGFLQQLKSQNEPKKQEDDDLELDLVLPLSLTNLQLATQSQPKALRPRTSMASVGTEWDSPSTSTSHKSVERFSWGDESTRQGRTSETSMTSVSDGLPEKSEKKQDDLDEDEDFEADLVLPDPTFFAAQKTSVLNRILDRKRKQQFAPPPQRLDLNGAHGGDDSFEDGLVLENARAELSHRRLEKNRRMRTVPVPFSFGADRKLKVPAEVQRQGRQSPVMPMSNRAGSSLGQNAGRTLSGGSQKETRRQTSPHSTMREPARAPSRARHSAAHVPPPQPPREQTTPSRLRTQKSFHHLPPQQPTLVRKQSLASLQDAIAAGHVRPQPDHFDAPPLRKMKSASRLTMPTESSLAKQRGSAPPVPALPALHHRESKPRIRQMEIPRRTKQWGDGTELEGIEDLRVEPPSTPSYPKLGRKSLEKSPGHSKEPESRKRSSGKPRRQRQPAMLIKNLGAVDKKKVIGEMTWNPQTLRWEGNEAILRDFDHVASSTRPALITHFTGSSVGNSPLAGAPAARIVGDMKFDPEKMCWVSLLPPGEDEPDPFEGMADDEDDEGLRGTIRGASGRKLVSIGMSGAASTAPSSRFVSESTHSVATTTASWEDRTLPQVGVEIPPELWIECRDAEERHKREMRGWTLRPAQSSSDLRDREHKEEKRLWEVRKLAQRS